MSEIRKPRICEILGVEVGERFSCNYPNKSYPELWVDEDGLIHTRNKNGYTHKPGGWAVCRMINHPEEVIRLPRLTDKELAICKAVGARYVSRVKVPKGDPNMVSLWELKPVCCSCYSDDSITWSGSGLLAYVDAFLFPSIKPGDCVEVNACCEEADNPELISWN